MTKVTFSSEMAENEFPIEWRPIIDVTSLEINRLGEIRGAISKELITSHKVVWPYFTLRDLAKIVDEVFANEELPHWKCIHGFGEGGPCRCTALRTNITHIDD